MMFGRVLMIGLLLVGWAVCVVADSLMKAVGEERGKSPAHVGGNG